MKSFTIMMATILVLTMTAVAWAGSTVRLRADIPFAFHAGNEPLPPGNYTIELRSSGSAATGSTILLLNAEGSVRRVLSAIPGLTRPMSPESCLVFHRYGDDYFLSTVRQSSIVSELAKTAAEKAVELAFSKGAKVQVAASKEK
jgi:hypothetical protein